MGGVFCRMVLVGHRVLGSRSDPELLVSLCLGLIVLVDVLGRDEVVLLSVDEKHRPFALGKLVYG